MKKYLLLLILPVLALAQFGGSFTQKKIDRIGVNTETNITLEDPTKHDSLTPDRVPYIDAGNVMQSSTVTEAVFEFITNLTSDAQAQLDAKLDDFSSTTDNALVRTDGTAGEAVQDSLLIVDDTGAMTGLTQLNTTTATEISYLDNVTSDIQTQIDSKLNKALTDTYIFVGDGAGEAQGVQMSDEASIANTGAVTLDNDSVIAKTLTGYTSGAGTVTSSDSVLSALQKIDGNDQLKEPLLTKGDLTESTSGVLTITGGTSAVIGTGTSIEVGQATTSTSGYLSSTDWNTFDGKQDTISGTTNQIDVISNVVSISDNPVFSGTDSLVPPSGTTAERGASVVGKFRYNTQLDTFEGYTTANGWGEIGGGGDFWPLTKLSTGAGNFEIGSNSVGGNLEIFSNGEGYLNMTGNRNIFKKQPNPNATNTFDMGEPFAAWKDIYLQDVKFYGSGGVSYGDLNSNASGITLRNTAAGGNLVLSADEDDVRLFNQPTGANDLAVATTKYVDDATPDLVTVKGGLLTYGTAQAEFTGCPDGFSLEWDSGETLGLKCVPAAALDVTVVGQVMASASPSTPDGYLYCDGGSYLRADYPDLFNAIGTAYGAVDGTHFNVPDFRGFFLRGQSDSTGSDPDAGSRVASKVGGDSGDNIGSYQTDAFQGFVVGDGTYKVQTRNSYGGAGIGGAGGVYSSGIGGNSSDTFPMTGSYGAPRLSTETRPVNVYVRYYIRFAPAAGMSSGVPLMALGSILTSDSVSNGELTVGTNGQVLTANSAAPAGIEWADPTGGGGSGVAEWVTATSYAVDDIVWTNNLIYQALVAHTSGDFETDLLAGNWVEMTSSIPLLPKSGLLTSNGLNNGSFDGCGEGETIVWDDSTESGIRCSPLATEAITNWSEITPTVITDTLGVDVKSSGTLTDQMKWRRVGENIEVVFSYYHQTTVGIAGTGTYRFKLPDNLQIDMSKVIIGAGNSVPVYGVGKGDVGGGSLEEFIITPNADGMSMSSRPVTNFAVGAGTSYQFSNTFVGITGSFKVPVVGWSSNNSVTAFECDDLECENNFSAKISAAGVVTDENVNWLNGDCSVTATSTYTCPIFSSVSSSPMNCNVTTESLTGGTIRYNTNVFMSSVQLAYNTITNGVRTGNPVHVQCSKSGSDHNSYNQRFVKVNNDAPETVSYVGFDSLDGGNFIKYKTQLQAPTGNLLSVNNATQTRVTALKTCRYHAIANFRGNATFTSGSIGHYNSGAGLVKQGASAPNAGAWQGMTISLSGVLNVGDYILLNSQAMIDNVNTNYSITCIPETPSAFITGDIAELTETVKTPSSVNPVMYSFEFGGATDGSNCTTDPCTIRQNYGSAASSVTRLSASIYDVTLVSGKFSATPNCTCSSHTHGISGYTQCSARINNATSISIYAPRDDGTFGASDAEVNVICHGVQ